MCLIVFAWKMVPGAPLIAAANRDEFYARPTAPAQWWEDCPDIYAGRDLQGHGTWMGVSRDGPAGPKFAAVTNLRAASEAAYTNGPSRGALVADYLRSNASAEEYAAELSRSTDRYKGYNLLLGDRDTLVWYSNRGEGDPRNGQPLPPGIYGLSNALLDSGWPKIVKTKAQFGSLICQRAPQEAYFEMLADTTRAPDVRLPDTGVPLDWERALSAVFIDMPGYGTRSSTVVTLYADAPAQLHEQFLR